MKTKVLFVSQDLIIQFIYLGMLESVDCDVDVCKSVDEAFLKFTTFHHYDLILTEIDFSRGIFGYDLSEKIRTYETQFYPGCRIPIIGMRSPLTAMVKKISYEKGIDLTVKKPILREQMQEILTAFVHKR